MVTCMGTFFCQTTDTPVQSILIMMMSCYVYRIGYVQIQQLTVLELSDGLMTIAELIEELTDDGVIPNDVTDALTALFHRRLITM
jgi:hypothetical protein